MCHRWDYSTGTAQRGQAPHTALFVAMVSDYERGRRTYSDAMAKRLGKTLKVKEERLRYGGEPEN